MHPEIAVVGERLITQLAIVLLLVMDRIHMRLQIAFQVFAAQLAAQELP